MRIGELLIKENMFFVIAGPCVIENEEITLQVARFLKETAAQLELPIVFKSSYDKANRMALDSFRGPGLEQGLAILKKVRDQTGLPLLSDVHSVSEISQAAEVLDMLQIPAFLSRQTDLMLAAAKTGLPINIKKGQFLAPWDLKSLLAKARSTGNQQISVTERGASFGYNNLVVDMRSIPIIQQMGVPVIFDATHSVQLPGGQGSSSGGQREFISHLARAAVAAGANGIFMEIHPHPESALCDGPNSLALEQVRPLLSLLKEIHRLVQPLR
jgi:2-dehydro-3-deoxyphosphooctonate aldolase (KDO 8-P synthase)